MKLDELAQLSAGLTADRFRERCPDPALAFLVPILHRDEVARDDARIVDDAPAGHAGDPLEATARIGREAFLAYAKSKLLSDTQDDDEPPHAFRASARSDVAFLVKSSRNPFQQMITVGRAPNNDLCLLRPTLSKFHAYFMRAGAGWSVTDQRSTNGSTIDERPIVPGAATQLWDGSLVGFGPEVRAYFFAPLALHAFLATYREGRLPLA